MKRLFIFLALIGCAAKAPFDYGSCRGVERDSVLVLRGTPPGEQYQLAPRVMAWYWYRVGSWKEPIEMIIILDGRDKQCQVYTIVRRAP